MLFIGPVADEATDEHDGYVAGRYRNGALSDIWTDVTRCAARTFTAYVAACECGWTGTPKPAVGFHSAQYEWFQRHFQDVVAVAGGSTVLPRRVIVDRSQFLGWGAPHPA
jgi:hypothetical protein